MHCDATILDRMKADHLAMYGTVRMVRGTCPECEAVALVIQGQFACCGCLYEKEMPSTHKRMVETDSERIQLSAGKRRELMVAQDFCCIYCLRRFGSVVKHKGRTRRLRAVIDHMEPWALTGHNQDWNLAAACHICNAWKGSRVFRTIEDARIYLVQRAEKEISDG